MSFPPLRRNLRGHFYAPSVTPGCQRVYVGKRALDDGWAMAIIRIDGCTDAEEARWVGQCIGADLLAHLCFSNQENIPSEAVTTEFGEMDTEWTVGVHVTLMSLDDAAKMVDFLTTYATPRGDWRK